MLALYEVVLFYRDFIGYLLKDIDCFKRNYLVVFVRVVYVSYTEFLLYGEFGLKIKRFLTIFFNNFFNFVIELI